MNKFKIEKWLYNRTWSKDGYSFYEIVNVNQNNGKLMMQNISDLTDCFEIDFDKFAKEYIGR